MNFSTITTYIPRIAIYRCGCDERFKTEMGGNGTYAFHFFHLGPIGELQSHCPFHKESLYVLSESGYMHTVSLLGKYTLPLRPLVPPLMDDEFSVEYK